MRCVGVWFIVLSPVNEKLLVSCGLCAGGGSRSNVGTRAERMAICQKCFFSLCVGVDMGKRVSERSGYINTTTKLK